MSGAPIIRIVRQRHAADCSVACLSMLLGPSYEDVLLAFRHNVKDEGATLRQVASAARRLGHALRFRRAVDVELDEGVLAVNSPKWPTSYHLVVLKAGLVVDTDETVWDADVFLSVYVAKPYGLLEVRP